MSKLNNGTYQPKKTSPVKTTGADINHEGSVSFGRDTKSELYLLAVGNMVAESSFYEKAADRDNRYATLVRDVALADPAWVAGFFPWLRAEGFMRTASVLGAAEAAKALCDAHRYDGVEEMIDGSLQRADEPGEFMAYWRSIAGRAQPRRYRVVQRGVARAVVRLYTEQSWLKYDSAKRAYRFGDVIDLVRPKGVLGADSVPSWQSDLFRYILDTRHKRDGITVPHSLGMIDHQIRWRRQAHEVVSGMTSVTRKDEMVAGLLDPDILRLAGLTWEDVLSALGSVVDKKDLWASMIPNMGLMALCRNLRNFDEVGLSDETAQLVAKKLMDPAEVVKSKQFPFRFLAAYQAVGSSRWVHPLEKALEASLANVPSLRGRTLILVDRSGSMWHEVSAGTKMSLADSAAVFGSALALRAQDADLVQFGSTNQKVPFRKGDSILRLMKHFQSLGGTYTADAVRKHFAGHDRVVIVTDEQNNGYYNSQNTDMGSLLPKSTSLYTWNLAGYRTGHGQSGEGNRHTFGGLSDSSFRLISMLEEGTNAHWPWEK